MDDGLIVRIIPDKEVAWHAGDGGNGPGNRKSLAIEICENPESDLAKATDNAAELTACLMHSYGIPLANVVQHNRWSGKNCPHLLRAGKPYTWQTFLAKVQGFYDAQAKPATQYIIQAGAFASRTAAQEYLAKLTAAGFPAFIREVQSNGN